MYLLKGATPIQLSTRELAASCFQRALKLIPWTNGTFCLLNTVCDDFHRV